MPVPVPVPENRAWGPFVVTHWCTRAAERQRHWEEKEGAFVIQQRTSWHARFLVEGEVSGHGTGTFTGRILRAGAEPRWHSVAKSACFRA